MADGKIKARIAALLAKAEKTDNEFERDAFMAKVNELLEQYQIEIWELRDTEDQIGITIGETRIGDTMSWGKDLCFALAKYYYAEILFFGWDPLKPTKRVYKVVGRESCRVTVELMLPFVISQIRQKARTMAKGYRVTPAVAERQIANALIIRVYRMIRARAASPASGAMGSNALVLIDEAKAAVNEFFPDAKESRARDLSHSKTAADHAEAVSLNHQATGKRMKLLA